jgi:hypothetical protein
MEEKDIFAALVIGQETIWYPANSYEPKPT